MKEYVFNKRSNKTGSTEINTYRKIIKSDNKISTYIEIVMDTFLSVYSIFWILKFKQKLHLSDPESSESMCWDLFDNLCLCSRNTWYGFSCVKSTKIMHKESRLIIWESVKLAQYFWTAGNIIMSKNLIFHISCKYIFIRKSQVSMIFDRGTPFGDRRTKNFTDLAQPKRFLCFIQNIHRAGSFKICRIQLPI